MRTPRSRPGDAAWLPPSQPHDLAEHFCIEMACQEIGGRVQLRLGVRADRSPAQSGSTQSQIDPHGDQHIWKSPGKWSACQLNLMPYLRYVFWTRRRIPTRHFFYEADRGSMNSTDMLKKLRAYYHFVKRQQRHKESFGIHPIRAVLVETTEESRANGLCSL